MEEDVSLLAMYGDVRSAVWGHGIGRCGDILVAFVLFSGLGGVGLDGGRLSKIRIGDRQCRVLDSLQEIIVHVCNLNLVTRCRIGNKLAGACFGLRGPMGNGISTWLTRLSFRLFINPPVSLGFLKIQTPKKLVDCRDLVPTCSQSAFAGSSPGRSLDLPL